MTHLPLDYNRRPWKEKYIDEETPMFARCFIFAAPEAQTVSICSCDNDIMDNVPRGVADRLIAARNAFCDAIVSEVGHRSIESHIEGLQREVLRR